MFFRKSRMLNAIAPDDIAIAPVINEKCDLKWSVQRLNADGSVWEILGICDDRDKAEAAISHLYSLDKFL